MADELSKEDFEALPEYLKRMLVALQQFPESWLDNSPLTPDWIENYQAAGSLGFMAGAFGLGLYPLYAEGLGNIAYRAGIIPGAPREYTYLGRAQMAEAVVTHYAGMAGTPYTESQLGLWEARTAYWSMQQQLAPFKFAWGSARLMSYLAPTPEAGMMRAFGFVFTDAFTRLVSAQAMMPGIEAAYAADPTRTMRYLQAGSVFYPFATEPLWGQPILGLPGVGEMTGGQFGASVGSWTIAQVGFWGIKSGFEEMMGGGGLAGFRSGFTDTLRSTGGISLMQPGLQFLLNAYTTEYIRNQAGIPLTGAESSILNQEKLLGFGLTGAGLAFQLSGLAGRGAYRSYLAEQRASGLLGGPLRLSFAGNVVTMAAGVAGWFAGGPIGGEIAQFIGGPSARPVGQTLGPWILGGAAAAGTGLLLRELAPESGSILAQVASRVGLEAMTSRLTTRALGGSLLGEIGWGLTALDLMHQAAQLGAGYLGMELEQQRQSAGLPPMRVPEWTSFGASATWGQGQINLDPMVFGALGPVGGFVRQVLSPFQSMAEALTGGPLQYLRGMFQTASEYGDYLQRFQAEQGLQAGVAQLRGEASGLYGRIGLRSQYYAAAAPFWDIVNEYYGQRTGIASVATGSMSTRTGILNALAESKDWDQYWASRITVLGALSVVQHFSTLAAGLEYPSQAYLSRSMSTRRIGAPGAFIQLPDQTLSGYTWTGRIYGTWPPTTPIPDFLQSEFPIPRPASPYAGPIGFGTQYLHPDVEGSVFPLSLGTVGKGMQYGVSTSVEGFLGGQLTEAQLLQNLVSYGFSPGEAANIVASTLSIRGRYVNVDVTFTAGLRGGLYGAAGGWLGKPTGWGSWDYAQKVAWITAHPGLTRPPTVTGGTYDPVTGTWSGDRVVRGQPIPESDTMRIMRTGGYWWTKKAAEEYQGQAPRSSKESASGQPGWWKLAQPVTLYQTQAPSDQDDSGRMEVVARRVVREFTSSGVIMSGEPTRWNPFQTDEVVNQISTPLAKRIMDDVSRR